MEREIFFLPFLSHIPKYESQIRQSPMVTIMVLCKNESLFLVFPDSSIRNGLSVCGVHMQNNRVSETKKGIPDSSRQHIHTQAHTFFPLLPLARRFPLLSFPTFRPSRLREIFIPKQKEQKKYLCSSMSKMFQPTSGRGTAIEFTSSDSRSLLLSTIPLHFLSLI